MAGGAKPSKTETAAETSSSDIEVACCSMQGISSDQNGMWGREMKIKTQVDHAMVSSMP